jgi:hypothetical protein
MKPSIARVLIAVTILALAMLTSVFSDLTGRSGGGPLTGSDVVTTRRADTTVFAQDEDEDDDDNEDDNEDDDDDDSDDECDDEDDNDEDEAEDDDDNGDDEDDDDNDEDEDDDDDNADEEDDDDNVDCDEDDDNEEDDEGDDDNDEGDDADNEDEVDDEEAEDDEPVDGDDDDDDDEDDAFTTPAGQTGTACAPGGIVSTAPDTEVQAVTTGSDLWLALPGDRLSVQAFADTPAGICLVLRLVEPLDYPAAPGIRVGSYIFQVEAYDEFGTPLETLPAQISVNVNYTAADVAGLDEQVMTLSRLDPLSQGWGSPPGVLLDPVSNWVWVLTTDTGIFVANVP